MARPKGMPEKIRTALHLYPCDLLFIHRDAENASPDKRRAEIGEALGQAGTTGTIPPAIVVVPVRMMEAWLLIDDGAIRKAANNPNGSVELNLPKLSDIERIPDPKDRLHSLILQATELSARRKRRFDVHSAVQRIPEYVGDFSTLRHLSAFSALEKELMEIIRQQAWDETSAP